LRKPHWSAVAAILLVISGSIVAIVADSFRTEPLSEFGSVPDFTLVERNGQTVVRSDFDGKVWIADFIFTSCGGACPLMTEQMSQLQDVLPEEVLLVSFTVDPTRDTPMVLASYADRHEADPDRWYFLTGSRDELYTLAQGGFHLAVDDTIGTEVEPIMHSSRFVLVDRAGNIRNYYDGTNAGEVSRIEDDVETLLSE
jgi:protein SCO1/2